MSLTVAKLKVTVEADTSGVKRPLADTDKQLQQVKKHAEETTHRVKEMGEAFSRIGGALSIGVTTPLVALTRAAVNATVKMDSLTRGLRAVAGSAEATEKQLKELHEVAKLPGLGFQEAVEGSIRLQAAGFSARQATDALGAFGNALATVGKGKDELDGVTLALGQIASKGKVFAEEINQINERVPQIRRAMIAAFGTADTEILQKAKLTASEFVDGITRELNKLPRVTGGLKNDFENASDSIQQSLDRMGKAVVPFVAAVLNKVVPAIESMTKAFAELPKETQNAGLAIAAMAAAAGPVALLIGKFLELRAVIGAANLAIIGRGGLIASLGLLAGMGIAGMMNAASDKKIKEAADNTLTTWEKRAQQLRDMVARSRRGFTDDQLANMAESPMEKELADLEGRIARLRKTEQDRAARNAVIDDSRGGGGAGVGRPSLPGRIDAIGRAAGFEKLKKAADDSERLAREAAAAQERRIRTIIETGREGAGRFLDAIDDKAEKIQDSMDKVRRIGGDAASRTLKTMEDAAEQASQAFGRLSDGWDDFNEKMQAFAKPGEEAIKGLRAELGKLLAMTEEEKQAFAIFGMAFGGLDPFRQGQASEAAGVKAQIDAVNAVKQAGKRAFQLFDRGPSAATEETESFQRSFIRNSRSVGRMFLRDIMGDARQRRQAFKGLFDDMRTALAETLNQKGRDLIKPALDSIGNSLKDALMAAAKSVQISVGALLSAAYQLFAVSQRKRKFGLLSVLGGIGGAFLGGVGGALAGYNLGNALDNGDVTGALFGGASAYAGHAFGGGSSGNPSVNALAGRSRSAAVAVNYNGPLIVNERSDLNALAWETARRMERAVRSGVG